jgi:hypothetical protein
MNAACTVVWVWWEFRRRITWPQNSRRRHSDEIALRRLVREQHRKTLAGLLGQRRRLGCGPCRVLAELLPFALPADLDRRRNEVVARIFEELVAVHECLIPAPERAALTDRVADAQARSGFDPVRPSSSTLV